MTAVTVAAGWIVAGTSGIRSKFQLAMPAQPILARADRDDLPTGSIRRVASAAASDYRNLVPNLTFDTGVSRVTTSSAVEKTHQVRLASLEPGVPAKLADRFGDLAAGPPAAATIPLPLKRIKESGDPIPLPPARPKLAYAKPDFDLSPAAPAPIPSEADVRTAVYDIEAHTVYLPNGRKLEAHSGLGEWMDDPGSMRKRMRGVTPPNTYSLTLRESLFHGVQAIRLNPIDETKMFGRDGILAHTYMLGSNGQSNGCVSFRDYAAFLQAFQRGEVNRMVVVERHGGERAAMLHGRPVGKYAFASTPSEPIFSRRRPVQDFQTQRADAGPPRADLW